MSKPKAPKVFDYLYSLDLGWCYGPVDSLNAMWVKDKSIFCGSARGRRNLCVNQPDLFGGDEKEGGVVGTVEFYPGTVDQIASEELAAREGLTPQDYPGYRNLCHTFFRGPMTTGQGFQWGTNNPYLPAVEANFTRIPRQLNVEYSTIWPEVDGQTGGAGSAGGDWSIGLQETGRSFVFGLPDMPPVPYTSGGGVVVGASRQGPAPSHRRSDEFCDANDGNEEGFGGERRDFVIGVEGDGFFERFAVPPLDIDIDSGLVYLEVSQTFFNSAWTAGQSLYGIRAYDAEGNQLPWVAGPEGYGSLVQFGPSHSTPQYTEWTHSWKRRVPPGTRSISYGSTTNSGLFGTSGLLSTEVVSLVWRETEPVYCDPETGGLGLQPTANPAHILYEVMTNGDWGKGESPNLIDIDSFNECSQVLYNEKFGLSLGWFRQSTIESFAQEILDHIKAFLFQNPETGLWQMRLLRDDYDRNTLPWLNPDNCRISNPKRKTWGETVNEIVVTYTDPETEEEASVTAHNLANIQVQGGINSENRNYYGVRNAKLAQTLANRDVIEAGTPLWSGVAHVDRSFWATLPGDVFRLTWPEEGIGQTIVRVMKIERGKMDDREITLHLTEDIFGVDALSFTRIQGSEARSFDPRPEPLDHAFGYPLPVATVLQLFSDDPDFDVDARDPDIAVSLMAARGPGVVDVEVLSMVPDSLGTPRLQPVALVTPVGRSTLTEPLWNEPTSDNMPREVVLAAGEGNVGRGSLLIIGSSVEDHEIVQLISYDTVRRMWTVERGVYDTVPRFWPVGTAVWPHPDSTSDLDETPRQGVVDYWWLPRTPRGRLPVSVATRTTWDTSLRPYRPIRPANCQIEGLGTLPFTYEFGSMPPTIEMSWDRRNRFSDDAVPTRWLAGDLIAESGQTVTLRFISPTGGLIFEATGLTGTSYTLDTNVLLGALDPVVTVEFWAVDASGRESFMAARREIATIGYGWAFGWGEDFGQATIPDPFEPDGALPAQISDAGAVADHELSEDDERLTHIGSGNLTNWLTSVQPIQDTGRPIYWEVECVAGTAEFNGYLGVATADDLQFPPTQNPIFGDAIAARGIGEIRQGNRDFPLLQNDLVFSGLPPFGEGDVVMFAFDPSTLGFWVGVNGRWWQNRAPGFTGPLTRAHPSTEGKQFFATFQTRSAGDSVRFRARNEDFNYPLPLACDPFMLPV